MKYFKSLLIIFLIVALTNSCGSYNKVSDYEKSKFKSMFSVDRKSILFPELDLEKDSKLEYGYFDAPYDAMLHVYDEYNRKIIFKKVDDEYLWIGEKVCYSSGRTFPTVDLTHARERIMCTYSTEPMLNDTRKRLIIYYTGVDPNLQRIDNWDITTLRDTLIDWKKLPPNY